MPIVGVLRRGLSGWRAQALLPLGSRLEICECFRLSFYTISLTQPSQCVGATPDNEDFETFIGAEKAKEIKGLFTNWIHKIYRKLSFIISGPLLLVLIRVLC